MAQWKQYSGMWTRQQQMQAVSAATWPGILVGATAFSWGYNPSGQLGLGDRIARSSPVQIGSLTNWKQLSAGNISSVGVKTDGTLWTWGDNQYGELGQNNTTYRSSPVQVGALTNWMKCQARYNDCFAIKTDNTLWSWGWNSNGVLGQNIAYNINKSSPTQVGSQSTWLSISSYYHITATKTDGTLWTWGFNFYGQLGDNSIINRSSPVQVGSDNTWLTVAAGAYHSVAIKTNGTMWSWGLNNRGQLGANLSYADRRSSPIQVGALTTWLNVSCGKYFTIATKTDGTLWSWGVNEFGQLGLNISYTERRSSPVQIGVNTNWNNIAAGSGNFIATTSSGYLFACGYNGLGSLGLGDVNNRSSPTQVGSVANWGGLSASNTTTIATQNIYTT